ncbi:hypothetical protein [Paracidovorax oryzae]|uniref:hypothetical protein n=1 Tax=Paracidovorax oryzae TaxID=862720 RepID=UPI000316CF0A|nr:hypothetical protein [Paracidovorax oryzae]
MNAKPIYIITAAVLAWGAWMFRYELVQPASGFHVYRLDRWTGDIAGASGQGIKKLDYQTTEPKQAEGWWSKYPRADEPAK